MEKTIWGAVLVALIAWWSAGPLGYANEEGIHYRRLFRRSHTKWQDVTRAEWSPGDMTLLITTGEKITAFRYGGDGPHIWQQAAARGRQFYRAETERSRYSRAFRLRNVVGFVIA
jgi:hypothetical protein